MLDRNLRAVISDRLRVTKESSRVQPGVGEERGLISRTAAGVKLSLCYVLYFKCDFCKVPDGDGSCHGLLICFWVLD